MAGIKGSKGRPDGGADTVDVQSLYAGGTDAAGSASGKIGTDTAADAEAAAAIESPEDRLLRTIAPRRTTAGPRLPRPGACVYLIIDKTILKEIPDSDTEKLKSFLAEIRLVSDVPDYDVSTDAKNITIIGTAERASNSLLAIATSLHRITPGIRILLGQGIIEHQEGGVFNLKGSPDKGTLLSWQAQEGNIYLTDELAKNIIRPGSREGSHCEIQTIESGAEGLMNLKSYKPRVERDTGGPDELIGYEEPLAQLNGFLRDDETKLVFLKGAAGIGKSRILSEVLATLPAHILCSLDAADRNIPGASLVTLSDQIAQIIQSEDDIWGEDLHALTGFSAKPRAEKIHYAQLHAKELAELCFNALQLSTYIKGYASVFILEDLHNADHFSEPILAGIAQRYAIETDGKVLVSMRPEEAYRSSAQDYLQSNVARFINKEAVQDVELKGLNFADEEISRRFAYHCMPVNRRGEKTVEQMGTWHQTLGKAAGNSPFVMTTLMRTVLEKEGALNTEGGIINVDRALIENFSEIRPDNPNALATYLHQRIANLSDNALIIIQAMALAGGRLIAKQIDQIIERMVGGAPIKKTEVFAALVEGGFIHQTKDKMADGDYAIWKFQQEFLIPFVISSITDQEYKRNMSRYLYGILANDRNTHPDTKLALLQGIVTGLETPEPDDDIWTSYKDAAMEALADAKAHNNSGKAGAIAASILYKTQGSDRIQAAITALKKGEEVPEALAQLAVAALMAAAESALNLGRFEEVTGHTTELAEIHSQNPDLIDIDKVNLMLFEKAYLSRNKGDMEQIFADSIERVDTIQKTTKIIAEIKIAFRNNKFDEVSRLFAEHQEAFEAANENHKTSHEGMPLPDYIEMLRLITVRIPFAAIRKKASTIDDATHLDSDCLMQPKALSEELRAKLENEVLPALERILTITKKFPTILSSHSELALLDQIAGIESFRGNWDSADKTYKEAWRIADQMQNHDAAARLAQNRGDNLVTQALLASRDGSHATTDMEKLKQAIAVYNREGAISISQLESNSFWSLLVRINRIRAISLLALRSEKETDKSKSALRIEMEPYFEQACQDFEIINEKHGAKIDPEIAYYLLGPFHDIRRVANKYGYPIRRSIKDQEKYPYMTIKACIAGLSHGANLTDRGLSLGEAGRKLRSLFRALESLRYFRDEQLAKKDK